MFLLNCKITIKGSQTWIFRRIIDCQIDLSAETLTDTCVITLPKKIKWQDTKEIPLKKGDAVTVELGYNDDRELCTRFVGYIRSVSTKTPVKINCEDSMWLLKQTPVEKKSYNSVTINQLLKDILPPGIEFTIAGEQNIGQYRIQGDNVAAVLNDLKKNGIKAYFKLRNDQPILHCGIMFPPEQNKKPVFREMVNIINNNTEYKYADDIKLKIKATSIMPDNKKYEIEIGDSDGEIRTLSRYNVKEAELRSWAEQELKKLKSDGLSGSITTFGIPETDKEDTVLLCTTESPQAPYKTKSVSIKFGAGGYRQTITLDQRI